ncbi:MAG: N-6 DNA methylase [Planctomycetota bacterium]|nr:N-6 DNA methylase [Planctomycetota bacterium]
MNGTLTPQAFAEKWRASTLKESAAYQSHFDDLCRMLGHPTPAELDPTGASFTYQKGVTKDLATAPKESTLFGPRAITTGAAHGFADVWFKDHFGWEYKGKHKSLEKAREQLLQYLDDLDNPELLVVCDFVRYEIHTRFNNCPRTVHRFTNDDIPKPETLQKLHALFENPAFFKPSKTVQAVTEEVAKHFATLSDSLRSRGVEAHAAAHFLMKLLFCLFAEDTGLLPQNTLTDATKMAVGRLKGAGAAGGLRQGQQQQKDESGGEYFARQMKALFRAMRRGGEFWGKTIDHFDGGLFEDDEAQELTDADLETLYDCCREDWSSVEPSIFGTLFERSLDPDKRSQIGAHYTGREDIELLVQPVLMAPLRREWEEVKKKALAKLQRRDESKGKEHAKRDKELLKLLVDFSDRISQVRVLDPACGSGNFLYVSLRMLKDLEKEVVTLAAKCGHNLFRFVGPEQLYGIEINPYAAELARLVVWIGHIQWDKDNGLYRPEVPILKPLENIKEMDAILDCGLGIADCGLAKGRTKRRTAGQASSGTPAAKEPRWPECDVIVGNPPFLGDKKLRAGLGHKYVEQLFRLYGDRIPNQSDLCCYWFEKARQHIKDGKCKRAGLLATQNVRGGASRKALERIKGTGDIFFAITDRDWVLDGANVHISMVGFDDGGEKERLLDGRVVETIHANLTCSADTTSARALPANRNVGFIGSCKGGSFDIGEDEALPMLRHGGNPHGRPNSDVLRPVANSMEVMGNDSRRWIIDNADRDLASACLYEEPHRVVLERVKPVRDTNRDNWLRSNWWRPQRMRPVMRAAIAPLGRFLVTPTTSKHRVFLWLRHPVLPDHKLVVFARDDDYFFGVLHSRFHEVWARAQGTQLRERESGQNYNVMTCFETFPLPKATAEQEQAIAAAAKELDTLRTNWLNPPEWTKEEVLEFPGSVDGPWARYIVPTGTGSQHRTEAARGTQSAIRNPQSEIGTVRYPRTVPLDADCAAKLAKRTLTNLYNERPTWLDLAHKKLDAAVCAAYGWPSDMSDEEILKRLLELNLTRASTKNGGNAAAV